MRLTADQKNSIASTAAHRWDRAARRILDDGRRPKTWTKSAEGQVFEALEDAIGKQAAEQISIRVLSGIVKRATICLKTTRPLRS